MDRVATKPKVLESFGLRLSGVFFEAVEDDEGRRRFICYDPVTKKLEVKDALEFEVASYGLELEEALGARLDCDVARVVPSHKASLLLPPPIEDVDVDAGALYEEVKRFIYAYIDFVHEADYDVVTSFVLLSWRFEAFSAVPYLLFLGLKESGKTHALTILYHLCRRAMFSSNLTPAVVYRAIDAWRPTLLVEEGDLLGQKSEKGEEIRAVLKTGYKEPGTVYRAERGANDRFELEEYNSFGPKAVALTEPLKDAALMDRFVVINMERRVREVGELDNEFKTRAKKLRGELLKYRLKYFDAPPPIERKAVKAAIGNDRLGELFWPLIAVAPRERWPALLEKARAMLEEKAAEEADSVNLAILKALDDLEADENGCVDFELLFNSVRQELGENATITPQGLGRRLKTLGFKRVVRGRDRLVRKDERILARHLRRFMAIGLFAPEKLDQACSQKQQKIQYYARGWPNFYGEDVEKARNLHVHVNKSWDRFSRYIGDSVASADKKVRPPQPEVGPPQSKVGPDPGPKVGPAQPGLGLPPGRIEPARVGGLARRLLEAFASKVLARRPGGLAHKADVYGAYWIFCLQRLIKPLNFQAFCQGLKRLMGLKPARVRVGRGKRVYAWRDLAFRALPAPKPEVLLEGDRSILREVDPAAGMVVQEAFAPVDPGRIAPLTLASFGLKALCEACYREKYDGFKRFPGPAAGLCQNCAKRPAAVLVELPLLEEWVVDEEGGWRRIERVE